VRFVGLAMLIVSRLATTALGVALAIALLALIMPRSVVAFLTLPGDQRALANPGRPRAYPGLARDPGSVSEARPRMGRVRPALDHLGLAEVIWSGRAIATQTIASLRAGLSRALRGPKPGPAWPMPSCSSPDSDQDADGNR
jgi:hypothetical protein